MPTDEKLDRILAVIERLEALLDKFQPILEKVEKRFQNKWGRSQ